MSWRKSECFGVGYGVGVGEASGGDLAIRQISLELFPGSPPFVVDWGMVGVHNLLRGVAQVACRYSKNG